MQQLVQDYHRTRNPTQVSKGFASLLSPNTAPGKKVKGIPDTGVCMELITESQGIFFPQGTGLNLEYDSLALTLTVKPTHEELCVTFGSYRTCILSASLTTLMKHRYAPHTRWPEDPTQSSGRLRQGRAVSKGTPNRTVLGPGVYSEPCPNRPRATPVSPHSQCEGEE